MLLLLVLARRTLNQILRQAKKVNVLATVDKHREVTFSLLYLEVSYIKIAMMWLFS